MSETVECKSYQSRIVNAGVPRIGSKVGKYSFIKYL